VTAGRPPAGVAPAADRVQAWLGRDRPAAALVLGSGLGRFTEALEAARRMSFEEIPGFPAAGVAGHAGELVLGWLGHRAVLCQRGRFHAYEGHDASVLALPVRVLARLGIATLVVTNAAGGIRRELRPGSLMAIADHLNLTFRNPLHGPVHPGEQRFPDMSEPYDAGLRGLAHEVATGERIELADGVYAGVAGPSYETPAEIAMLDRMGADAVGMSTTLEVVAARAAGLRVSGFSLITNMAAGRGGGRLTHEEVLSTARAAAGTLERLLGGFLSRI
jgi:purine-nucleoside phosphorylase